MYSGTVIQDCDVDENRACSTAEENARLWTRVHAMAFELKRGVAR